MQTNLNVNKPNSSYFSALTQPIKNSFNRITQTAQQTWQIPKDFVASTKWYQRTITPLKPLDYTLFTTSVILSVIIDIVAIKRFEIGIAPVLVATDFLVILASCLFSRYRLRNYFDKIACKVHLENLRMCFHNLYEAILNTSDHAQIVTNINEILTTLLTEPEFSHQKEKWESLKTAYEEFSQQFIVSGHPLCHEHQKELLLTLLNGLAVNEKNPGAKQAIENLHNEIKRFQFNEITAALNDLKTFDLFDQTTIDDKVENLLKAPKITDELNVMDQLLINTITKLGGTPIN